MPEEISYGTEPPGEGWKAVGAGKWVRDVPDKQPEPPEPLRIAVIGGGPGGLFATYILNQRLPAAEITILEASERLGGKIRTDRFADGTPFEAGVAELYEYLGPGGKDPLRSLIENDLALPTVNMTGGCVVMRDEIVRDADELGEAFGKEARKQVEKFHKRTAELMPLEKYAHRWQPDNAHAWANLTFREAVHQECDDCAACCYIMTAVHSDLATEPHTCNGLNGIKNVLMDNKDYMQLYHVAGGIERIVFALDEAITAERWTGARVTEIYREEDEYCVGFTDSGQDRCEFFDLVVICLPNHWLNQINFLDEKMAEAVHATLAHYDLPAHYLRVSLLYEEAWWQNLRIAGDYWMMDMMHGCCVYNESTRWRSSRGHVLSFLLAGQDALNLCANNQTDEEIVEHLLDCLPQEWREEARGNLLEAQVDRYVGSINAQPGGWPAEELRGEHWPCPDHCPGIFIVGDYLFDSTLNACLISAWTAVDCLCEHLGAEGTLENCTEAIRLLEPEKKTAM